MDRFVKLIVGLLISGTAIGQSVIAPNSLSGNGDPSNSHPPSAITIGSGFMISGTYPNYTISVPGATGTVTTLSVATANGFAGTVANPTTTPAITVKTSVTGLLQGNGTAISAATTTGTGAYVEAVGPTITLPNATGLPLTTGVTGILPVANGGNGTATPTLTAGTNVMITGSWPNYTINSSGGGGSSAWSAITGGNNTGQTFTVGNSSTFGPTGSGVVTANALQALTDLPNQNDQTLLSNGTGSPNPPVAATLGCNLVATATSIGSTYPGDALITAGTYAISTSDMCGALLSFNGTTSVTLAAATTTGYTAGASVDLANVSASTSLTVTPTTSTMFYNGTTNATLTIRPSTQCSLRSNGTNYDVSFCTAIGSATSLTSLTGMPSQAARTAVANNTFGAAAPTAITFGALSGVYNVLDYCTHSPDCTSANDTGQYFTAAIQAANTAATSAGGKVTLYIPQGHYNYDPTTNSNVGPVAITVSAVCVAGAGMATLVSPVNTGAQGGFLDWTSTSQNGCLHDINIGASDTPTSSALVLIDRSNNFTAANFTISGGFNSLLLQSVSRAVISNFVLSGANGTAGSAQLVVKRNAGGGAANSAEFYFDNCDIRSSGGTAYVNAVQVADVDGLSIGNCHIGFSSGSIFLIQPLNNNDQLDNIRLTGTHLDGNNVSTAGVDFEPYAGTYMSKNFQHFFGGNFQIGLIDPGGAPNPCFLINDPAVKDITISGVLNKCDGPAVDIEAGQNIVIGPLVTHDASAQGSGDSPVILVNATTNSPSDVVIDSVIFGTGATVPTGAISLVNSPTNIFIGTNDNQLGTYIIGEQATVAGSGGGCGTIGTLTKTNGGFINGGSFVAGAVTACQVTITFGGINAATNNTTCFATDGTHPLDIPTSIASTATTATINYGTITSGDTLKWGCVGY